MKYVLIAEDDPDISSLLEDAIGERLFVATHVVANGALVHDAIIARRPDLLILDLGLPGLSGNDVVDLMQNDPAYAGLPVLILTASPERAPNTTGLRVIGKPFDLDFLLMTVDAMVDGVPAAA